MPDSMVGLLFSNIVLIRKSGPSEKKSTIKKTARLVKKLHHWSATCPENFNFAYFWLSAELAVLEGQNEKAMALFDEAIDNALKYGFENFVAIISESASEFYIKINRLISAKSYYQLAYNYYLRWGAVLKCQQLTQKRRNWDISTSSFYNSDNASISTVTSKSLDLESIMKASVTISGEVNLEKLLEKILTIALENAGAQIGAFIFKEKENLKLVAYTQDATNTIINLQDDILLLNNNIIPLSLINYVDRTLETLK
jgi:tetratricopeptide (TPR) repeat protein